MTNKIAITMGDPASISTEIILKSLAKVDGDFVLVGSRKLIDRAQEDFGLKLSREVEIVDINYDMSGFKYGEISAKNGDCAFKSLIKAIELAKNNQVSAIVTAPISKEAFHMACHCFSGQTEVLQKYLAKGNQKAEMLFAAGDFRVLLLTRHIPVSEVAKSITSDLIISKTQSLISELKTKFNIKAPKIALCGLNPHAGEEGILGTEEAEFFNSSVKSLEGQGADIKGPFSADTLLAEAASKYLKGEKQRYDCFIACYHDQGLTPIKAVAFDETVNISIGLDVLRTSPAHGTAFDIAGKNVANPSSMVEAIKIAQESL